MSTFDAINIYILAFKFLANFSLLRICFLPKIKVKVHFLNAFLNIKIYSKMFTIVCIFNYLNVIQVTIKV